MPFDCDGGADAANQDCACQEWLAPVVAVDATQAAYLCSTVARLARAMDADSVSAMDFAHERYYTAVDPTDLVAGLAGTYGDAIKCKKYKT